jgi:hypothetical protein
LSSLSEGHAMALGLCGLVKQLYRPVCSYFRARKTRLPCRRSRCRIRRRISPGVPAVSSSQPGGTCRWKSSCRQPVEQGPPRDGSASRSAWGLW